MQKDRLLGNLRTHFNESELRDVCFLLDIDYEDLAGDSKADKTRELVLFLERHARLSELLEVVSRLRSRVSWDETQQVDEVKILKLMDSHAETNFLKDFPEGIRSDFETAEEAWLIGFSLVRTIRPYFHVIQEKLKKDHIIKVLLVHPKDLAVEAAVQRSYKPTDTERKQREIMDTLDDLCVLRKRAPENLHIRTIRFPLGYGVQAMNPETDSGVLYVKLYPYKLAGDKPKFVLHASYSPWYRAFIEEIKALWSAGVDWQCERVD